MEIYVTYKYKISLVCLIFLSLPLPCLSILRFPIHLTLHHANAGAFRSLKSDDKASNTKELFPLFQKPVIAQQRN
jgi:hypothetical protein